MPQNQISPIQRLVDLLKNNKKHVGQIYWLAFFTGIISLSLPFGIQLIVNFIQGGTYSYSYYVLVVLITLGMVLYSVFQIIELRILENIQQKIFVYAGIEFTYRFPKIKIEELMNINARDLANRFFDSIVLEKSIIKLLTEFGISVVQIILSALVLCFYHSSFLLVNIIVLVILYIGFKYTFNKTLYAGIAYSRFKYKTAYWIEEVAGASSSFKLAGITELPMQKTDVLLSEYIEARENYYRWLNIQYITLNITKVVFILGFLLIGGIMVMEQVMNIGQFVAAEVLIITVINGIDKILNTLKNVYDTLISLEKLAEVTDMNIEVFDHTSAVYNDKQSGAQLNIIHLHFQYPQSLKYALKNINLDIKSNEKVLIAGESNSGKTTLIKVISSLYAIKDGDIKYNGISIKHIDKEKLRNDMGIYFQEDVIFNGTIWENITLGRPWINEKYVYQMADKINFTKELEALSNGYNTYMSAHGFGYSLSFINKILFLRVMSTQPKLLLMENIYFNFIKEERKKIIEILTEKTAPWTLICISEIDELSKCFDTICILDKGEIIKKGIYSEIIHSNQ